RAATWKENRNVQSQEGGLRRQAEGSRGRGCRAPAEPAGRECAHAEDAEEGHHPQAITGEVTGIDYGGGAAACASGSADAVSCPRWWRMTGIPRLESWARSTGCHEWGASRPLASSSASVRRTSSWLLAMRRTVWPVRPECSSRTA